MPPRNQRAYESGQRAGLWLGKLVVSLVALVLLGAAVLAIIGLARIALG